jgi:hypothetical protein
VDRFVATGSVEKGKSMGRPPVNEEIVEDLRQRMEQSPKNPSGSYDMTSSSCTTLHLSESLKKNRTCILTKSQHCKNFDQLIQRGAKNTAIGF